MKLLVQLSVLVTLTVACRGPERPRGCACGVVRNSLTTWHCERVEQRLRERDGEVVLQFRCGDEERWRTVGRR